MTTKNIKDAMEVFVFLIIGCFIGLITSLIIAQWWYADGFALFIISISAMGAFFIIEFLLALLYALFGIRDELHKEEWFNKEWLNQQRFYASNENRITKLERNVYTFKTPPASMKPEIKKPDVEMTLAYHDYDKGDGVPE